MDDLDRNHRLFTEHFPDDGRHIPWTNDDERRAMLQGRVNDYVTTLGLSIEDAVDHIISGQDPCDPRLAEPPVPLPVGTSVN